PGRAGPPSRARCRRTPPADGGRCGSGSGTTPPRGVGPTRATLLGIGTAAVEAGTPRGAPPGLSGRCFDHDHTLAGPTVFLPTCSRARFHGTGSAHGIRRRELRRAGGR